MGGRAVKRRGEWQSGLLPSGGRPDKSKEYRVLSAIHHDVTILMVGVFILAAAPVRHCIDL